MLTFLLLLSLSAPAAAPNLPVLIHRTRIDGRLVEQPDIESAVLAELRARSLTPKITDGSLEACLQQEPPRAPDECAVLLMHMVPKPAKRGLLVVVGAAGDPDNAQLRLLDLLGTEPPRAFMFNSQRDHMSEWFNQIVAPALLDLNVTPPKGPAAVAAKIQDEPDEQQWKTSEKVIVGVGITEAALGLALNLSLLGRNSGVVSESGVVSGRFTLGSDAPRPFARTFGIPAAPVGIALMLAGGASAAGTAIFRDKKNAQWWSLLVSHVVSGAALTATLLLQNPNPAPIDL